MQGMHQLPEVIDLKSYTDVHKNECWWLSLSVCMWQLTVCWKQNSCSRWAYAQYYCTKYILPVPYRLYSRFNFSMRMDHKRFIHVCKSSCVQHVLMVYMLWAPYNCSVCVSWFYFSVSVSCVDFQSQKCTKGIFFVSFYSTNHSVFAKFTKKKISGSFELHSSTFCPD